VLAGVGIVLALAPVVERLIDAALLFGRYEKREERIEDRRTILRQSGIFDYMRRVGRRPPLRIADQTDLRNLLMIDEIQQIGGGQVALISAKNLALMNPYMGLPTSPAHLDHYAVDLLLLRPPCRRRRDLRLLRITDRTCLYANPSAKPRFGLVDSAVLAVDETEMIERVANDPAGADPIVGLSSEEIARRTDPDPQIVLVRSYEPGRAELIASTDQPSLLLVRETLVKGWHAAVNGERATIYPAGGLFFAVPLPVGVNDVTIRYQTPGLRSGAAFAAAWFAAAFALFGSDRWRRRSRSAIRT